MREKLLIKELLLLEVATFRVRILRVPSFTKVSSLPKLVALRNFRAGRASYIQRRHEESADSNPSFFRLDKLDGSASP